MKTISFTRLLLGLFVICSGLIKADPTTHAPGLLCPCDGAVSVSQADFNSGTFRIQQPGYYYLIENVVFCPNPVAEAQR